MKVPATFSPKYRRVRVTVEGLGLRRTIENYLPTRYRYLLGVSCRIGIDYSLQNYLLPKINTSYPSFGNLSILSIVYFGIELLEHRRYLIVSIP